MKFVCKVCKKTFEGEDHFSQFLAEPAKEPVQGTCDECTAAEIARLTETGEGREQLEAEWEKETRDCILK